MIHQPISHEIHGFPPPGVIKRIQGKLSTSSPRRGKKKARQPF